MSQFNLNAYKFRAIRQPFYLPYGAFVNVIVQLSVSFTLFALMHTQKQNRIGTQNFISLRGKNCA